ncbi:MAG: DsbA family protein [Candidatus Omnitrophota bacterium]
MKNNFAFGLLIILAVTAGFFMGRMSTATVGVGGKAVTAPAVEKKAAVKAEAPVDVSGMIPSRGPERAKVQITVYADFRCPYCKRANEIMQKIVTEFPNDVRWTFRHFPLSQTPGEGSFLIHEAAACATEQGKFWPFHDKVLGSVDISTDKAGLAALAAEIGLDVKKYETCLENGKYRAFLKGEREAGSAEGVRGTPSFFINGHSLRGGYDYESLKKTTEALIRGEQPSREMGLVKEGPVEFGDLENRPAEGPENALVTLVEFSDFHCPFSKRVYPTLKKVKENYGDKIRHVFRHFPLPFHEGAKEVHAAAECAFLQGKFWEYHDGLFSAEQPLKTRDELLKLAEEKGLDRKALEKCLESGETDEEVSADISKGEEAGVDGTPTVFVNGKKISGASPYESFEAAIKAALEKK